MRIIRAARELPVCGWEVVTFEISIQERLIFSAAELRDDVSNLLRKLGIWLSSAPGDR